MQAALKASAASGSALQSASSGRRGRRQGAGQSSGAVSILAVAPPVINLAAPSLNAALKPARDDHAAADSAFAVFRGANTAALGPKRSLVRVSSAGPGHGAASDSVAQAHADSASGDARNNHNSLCMLSSHPTDAGGFCICNL